MLHSTASNIDAVLLDAVHFFQYFPNKNNKKTLHKHLQKIAQNKNHCATFHNAFTTYQPSARTYKESY